MLSIDAAVGHRPAIFHNWEVEPEDNEEALANMEEYALAGSIYGALLESQVCEMASRMTAMDSATANATEMVERFTLQYNRCVRRRAHTRARHALTLRVPCRLPPQCPAS